MKRFGQFKSECPDAKTCPVCNGQCLMEELAAATK